MNPDVVVDVGNSRIKWARCGPNGIDAHVSLPPDASDAWQQEQLDRWGLSGCLRWVVSGVNPRRQDALIDWLELRGDEVLRLERAAQLPLQVRVQHPDRVGIDRLLDAVAANSRGKPETPAIIIDAGSAVTVDFVDGSGAFRGGTIFPGLRLMTRSLRDYTALLPDVTISRSTPPLPGNSTTAAMEAGVYYAVVGGINHIIRLLDQQAGGNEPQIFLTGGDAHLLKPDVDSQAVFWPEMTLEGVRLAAEALP